MKDKKYFFIFLITLFLLIFIFGSVYLFFIKPKISDVPLDLKTSATGKKQSSNNEFPQSKTLIWTDQAGFKFNYSADLIVDSHPEDKENYSYLDFSLADKSGMVKVLVQDTDYREIDEYLKKEVSEGKAEDTTLGGRPAKKIYYPSSKKIVIAAIDVDALILVGMEPIGNTACEEAFGQIVGSFEYIPVAAENKLSPASYQLENGLKVIEEPEEIIQ